MLITFKSAANQLNACPKSAGGCTHFPPFQTKDFTIPRTTWNYLMEF